MTVSSYTHRRLAPVAVLVCGLVTLDWLLRPERAWFWLFVLALMAAIWVFVALQLRLAHSADETGSRQRSIVRAGWFAGALLVTGLVVSLLRGIGLEHSWLAERAPGIVMGLVLLVMGNALPKMSAPLTTRRCVDGGQATRRFAGWMFAIAGAIYLAVWLFAPIAEADVVATVTCAAATALVIGRCVVGRSAPLDGSR